MKNNIVWIVLFINLLAVGMGFIYVAARPTEIRGLMNSDVQKTLNTAVANVGGMSPSSSSTRKSSPPPPKANTGEVAAASSDTKSASKTPPPRSSAPPPASSSKAAPPPPKKGSNSSEESESLIPTRETKLKKEVSHVKTVYMGSTSDPITSEPPPPELYPFRIDRRTFPPNSEDIEIEISVQNASGYFWKNVYIVLKSSDHKKAQIFSTEEWRIDEIATLNYRFPKAEIERRLRNLRVVDIRGERLESTLASHVSKIRSEAVKRYGSGESVSASGDTSQASGLLGLWASAASTLRSSHAKPVEETAQQGEIEIILPKNMKLIPNEFTVRILDNTPERSHAIELLQRAHEAAYGTQDRILRLVDLINSQSYFEAMNGQGATLVAEIGESKSEYDKVGIELALLLSRSTDDKLNLMQDELNEMTKTMVGLIDFVEKRIQTVDGGFSLSK